MEGLRAQTARISFGELVMDLLDGRIRRLFGHFAAVPLSFLVIMSVVVPGGHRHASIRSTSGSLNRYCCQSGPCLWCDSTPMWITIRLSVPER